MNKRTLVALAILLLLLGGWYVVWLSSEPRHQGKTLRDWVAAVDQDTNDVSATQGLQRILPRAVPYYVRILRGKESRLQRLYRSLWPRLPGFLQDQLAAPYAAEVARMDAAMAIEFAGPHARSAVPDVIDTLKDQNEGVRQRAAEALGRIEPDARLALPALIEASQDPFFGVRRSSVEALGRYGPAAKPAVPALMVLLKDSNQTVRASAAGALWEVDRQTNTVMRVLAETFRAQDPIARALSARHLGHLREAAKPLVPALVEALRDFKTVADEARVALRSIDPDAAARAGR